MTGYTATYIKVTGVELYYDGQNGFRPNLADAEAYADEADADATIARLSAENPTVSLDKTQKMVPGSDERDAPLGDDAGPEAGEGTLADTATTGDTQPAEDDGLVGDDDHDMKHFPLDKDAKQVEPHDDSEFGTGDNEDGSRQLGSD